MTDIEKIKQKLIKLIRLSEDDTVKDGEISNALAKAQQIMAQHNLTREDIDSAAADPYEKVKMDRTRAFFYGVKRTAWESHLGIFICDFHGTVKVYTINESDLSGKRRACLMFYGPADEAECAADLFAELSTAIAMMATTRYGGFARKDGATYAEGFVTGLAEKLTAEKILLRNPEDEKTAALMVVSDERSLAIRNKADLWLAKDCGINLGRGSGTRGAFNQGRTDGSNYSVSRRTPTRKLA